MTVVWALVALGCGNDTAPSMDSGVGDADAAGDAAMDAPLDTAVDTAPPPPDDSPLKGPWALRTSPEGAVVRWETQLEPTVEISVTPEDGGDATLFTGTSRADEVRLEFGEDLRLIEFPDVPGTYHLNEVELTGLAAGTCYTYAITDYPEDGGRFCTAFEPTDHTSELRFVVVGDTSPFLESTQKIVAELTTHNPQAWLHAGDIQYYAAVFESWQLWWNEMQPMMSAAAFFPTIGNHEQERDFEFEDTYARWWQQPGTDGTTSAYHYESGGVHFFSVNSESDIGEFDDDFSWLDERLTEVAMEPGYRFSIVYYHRPIYALSDDGPSLSLRALLEPIIERHRVPLVLQGHNHVYERFLVDDVTYLVVGGGGAARYDIDGSVEDFPDEVPLRLAGGSFFHGAVVTVNDMDVHVDIIDDEGATQDSFDIDVSTFTR